jgi:hypothetical protein
VNVDDTSSIYVTRERIRALRSPDARPLAAIVIDPGRPARTYDLPVRLLYQVADIMIRIGDSSAMNTRPYRAFSDWKTHVDDCVRVFLGLAKYWEVANEPNQPESFIGRGAYDKYRYAQDTLKEKGQLTAATYLMGAKDNSAPGCYFVDWILANPLDVDLSLASCYPFQLRPTLPQSLPALADPLRHFMLDAAADIKTLHQLCPKAKGVGWGEFGGELRAAGRYAPLVIRAELCRQFYGAQVDVPNFVNFGSYWDYVRDCVRQKSPIVQDAISDTFEGGNHGEEKR